MPAVHVAARQLAGRGLGQGEPQIGAMAGEAALVGQPGRMLHQLRRRIRPDEMRQGGIFENANAIQLCPLFRRKRAAQAVINHVMCHL